MTRALPEALTDDMTAWGTYGSRRMPSRARTAYLLVRANIA